MRVIIHYSHACWNIGGAVIDDSIWSSLLLDVASSLLAVGSIVVLEASEANSLLTNRTDKHHQERNIRCGLSNPTF